MKPMRKKFLKRRVRPPKECYFCASKTEPTYQDVTSLNRFISERGKMIPKMESGLCSKHQRRLTEVVKRARYLAIIPFIVRPS